MNSASVTLPSLSISTLTPATNGASKGKRRRNTKSRAVVKGVFGGLKYKIREENACCPRKEVSGVTMEVIGSRKFCVKGEYYVEVSDSDRKKVVCEAIEDHVINDPKENAQIRI